MTKIKTWDEFWDLYSKKNPDPRKADCYKCIHRENALGSAHSSCHTLGDKSLLWLALGALPSIDTDSGRVPVIRANETGIRKGWFAWPIDFDPVWLEWCLLFEAKDV